jgi:type IV secretion system protein VirB9
LTVTDYWVAGSEEISPTAARDDGRFIYLTFSNNRDMPAVYSVDAEGKEALITTNVIDGNTIVIQRLVNQLILRKGNAVASVLNKSFELNGGTDNTSGTIAPDVQRVIKGGKS